MGGSHAMAGARRILLKPKQKALPERLAAISQIRLSSSGLQLITVEP